MKRVAIVVSHPIQHFCPQYRSWTELGIAQVKVFFGTGDGAASYFDSGFQRQISWGEELLQGFDHDIIDHNLTQGELKALRLIELLSKYKPDVVIIYGYSQRLQRVAISWCLKNRIPMAYVADSELRHEERRLKRFAKKLTVSRVLQRMEVILSVGDANEEYYAYMRVNPSRVVKMHFPIDRMRYDRSYANRLNLRRAERARLGLNERDVAVLMVGKLAINKRQGDLISAVDNLQESDVTPTLLLAGSGPQEAKYATQVACAPQSRLLGFVRPTELPALYAAADIYAHVSSYDPHPLAVSEAIAMGLPVVCTRSIGSWGELDDVVPYFNGFVVDVRDVHQISHALELFSKSPELRSTYGGRSRTRSEMFQEIAHRAALMQIVERI